MCRNFGIFRIGGYGKFRVKGFKFRVGKNTQRKTQDNKWSRICSGGIHMQNMDEVVKFLKLGYTAAKTGVDFEELVELVSIAR